MKRILYLLPGLLVFANCYPLIHDITTDVDHPPQFVALLAARGDAPNPPEYDGPETAARQQKAYPDLKPLYLNAATTVVFPAARRSAEAMGWQIVAAVEAEGRIEAVATTRLFRFKDDVVVRVRSEGEGSRVDVRSKSRVGKSDLGANAKRILLYLDELRRRIGEP